MDRRTLWRVERLGEVVVRQRIRSEAPPVGRISQLAGYPSIGDSRSGLPSQFVVDSSFGTFYGSHKRGVGSFASASLGLQALTLHTIFRTHQEPSPVCLGRTIYTIRCAPRGSYNGHKDGFQEASHETHEEQSA